MIRRLPTRTIALIAGLIALAFLAFAIPSCLQKQRSERAQTRVDKAQGTATVKSAREAGKVQADINSNQIESEALGRSNEKDIRNAEGSDAPVAAPARDAGLRAICLRRVYRDTERCRLLIPR